MFWTRIEFFFNDDYFYFSIVKGSKTDTKDGAFALNYKVDEMKSS